MHWHKIHGDSYFLPLFVFMGTVVARGGHKMLLETFNFLYHSFCCAYKVANRRFTLSARGKQFMSFSYYPIGGNYVMLTE